MKKETEKNGMSRRKFINSVALTGAAFSIVPRNVLGGKGHTAPSDKLNIAVVGAGGYVSEQPPLEGEHVGVGRLPTPVQPTTSASPPTLRAL